MSNSVVFLLIAIGLSVVGSCAVWLHSRPRRAGTSVDLFNRSLRALSSDERRHVAPSGVVVRRAEPADDQPVDDAGSDAEPLADLADESSEPRSPRPSPRPAPRATREGHRPGS